nr:hypothetical protein [Promineifilum sp.]
YLVQAHALAFGAQTARVGVYKLLDILLPEGGESFGILRPDGSRRPAFDAYRTTVRYLGGFTYPVGRQRTADFYSFTFNRPEGVTRVLWARRAADVTVQLPVLAAEARLVSATGEEQALRAVGGFYRVRLRGARCAPACDVGGPPVFVVESGETATAATAVATVNPTTVVLATVTPTATANVTATVIALSATPTATPTTTPEATATPTASSTPRPTDTPPPTATIALPIATDAPPATEIALAATQAAPDDPTDSDGRAPMASWVFLGAAVVLAVVLGAALYRRRA